MSDRLAQMSDRECVLLEGAKAAPGGQASLTALGPRPRRLLRGLAIVLMLLLAGWAAPQTPQPAKSTDSSYVQQLTDQTFFQDPRDSGKRMYLPRYRLAEQTVSGDRQYQVRFFKQGTGWNLEIYLEKYPAPELGDAVRTAQEYPHQVDVLARYTSQTNRQSNQAQKELTFQEVTIERDGVRAVLHLEDLGIRDVLVQALQEPRLEATLVARRTFTVRYLPSSEISSVESQIQDVKRNMDWARPHVSEKRRLDEGMDRARYTNDTAEFRRLLAEKDKKSHTFVQADHILETWGPRELSRLETDLQNFRKGISTQVTLDNSLPSTFDRNLHSYVFAGINPDSGTKPQLVRKQLPWQKSYYSYFRPADQTDLWYYLPDRFVLAEEKQMPGLSVQFSGPPESQTVALEYVAVPWTQPDRLKVAAEDLRPTATKQVTLEPLLVEEATLWVVLPGGDSEGSYQRRPNASVSLRDGLRDKLRLTPEEFQQVYTALFSNSLLLTGEVRLDLGSNARERIPFEARVTQESPEAYWDKILSKVIFADYQKTIRVKTSGTVFGKEVKNLVVEFRDGETVELRQDQLEALAKVRLPMRDFILNTEQSGQYLYKVTTLRERDGKSVKSEMPSWKTASATILYPEVP
jgi:hypothetical protein